MTREEVSRLFSFLKGQYLLMAQSLYGSGLHLLESIHLKVKDIDFASNLLIVSSGKEEKDRTTILPDKLKDSLESHLQRIKLMHDQDVAKGYEGPTLADALEKIYPNPNKERGGNGCSLQKTWWSILSAPSSSAVIFNPLPSEDD